MRGAAHESIGVLIQWSSGLLLLLFFYRLDRVGGRGAVLRVWMAAWAALAMSLSGFAVRAIAALTGSPAAAPLPWLDDLYLPGRLLFICLVGLGAFEAVGRGASRSAHLAIALGAIALGTLSTIVDQPALTGTLLVAATVAVFLGAPIAITSINRRRRGGRVPLLAAMILFGAVTTACLVGEYFGDSLGPLGAGLNALSGSADYAIGLGLMILGAAVSILILEDTARGVRHLDNVRARDRAESELRLAGIMAAADAAISTARRTADSERETLERRVTDLVAVAAERDKPFEVAEVLAPLRAPAMQPRTVTLPRPPRRADGSAAEALLIDDEAEERATLARIFQRGGWAVREAATAEEALTGLLSVGAHTAPAVVLCDLTMTGMGGREVYEHLQRDRPEFLGRLIFVVDTALDAPTASFLEAAGCQTVSRSYTVGDIGRAVDAVLSPGGG